MAEFTFGVSESKMFYAVIRQGISIIEKIQAYKSTILSEYFPNANTQWDSIKKVLDCGVTSKIAWTGMSMTKADSVPDDTRIPPAVDVNAGSIILMLKRAETLGVTLSPNFVFDDPPHYIEAAQTWSVACKIYLDIKLMLQELMLYQIAAGEFEGSVSSLTRSAAQLIMFDECEIPLADGNLWIADLSFAGMRSYFGEFYYNFLLKTAEEVAGAPLFDLSVSMDEIVSDGKVANPDNPEVQTDYTFEVDNPDTQTLLGAILATALSEPVSILEISYTDSTSGKITISSLVDDAPSTLTITAFIGE